MKVIHTKGQGHLKDLYTVNEISPRELSPTANFVEVSRNLKSFSLNTFTINDFTREVQRRFANNNT